MVNYEPHIHKIKIFPEKLKLIFFSYVSNCTTQNYNFINHTISLQEINLFLPSFQHVQCNSITPTHYKDNWPIIGKCFVCNELFDYSWIPSCKCCSTRRFYQHPLLIWKSDGQSWDRCSSNIIFILMNFWHVITLLVQYNVLILSVSSSGDFIWIVTKNILSNIISFIMI